MLTHAQIDEQVALERDQIRQGLKRLRDQSIKLEDKSYASATIYGISSIDTLLPLLVQRIDETNRRIHERKNGVAFKDINTYLSKLEPMAAAAIACKLTFDKVFSFKEKSNQIVKVCEAIGKPLKMNVKCDITKLMLLDSLMYLKRITGTELLVHSRSL